MKFETAAALIGAERFVGYVPDEPVDEFFEPGRTTMLLFKVGDGEDAGFFQVEAPEDFSFEKSSGYLWKLTLEPIIKDES